MNPAFILIVLIVAVTLWFLLSFVFYPLGRIIYRIWKDACDEMNRKDKVKKDEKENN